MKKKAEEQTLVPYRRVEGYNNHANDQCYGAQNIILR